MPSHPPDTDFYTNDENYTLWRDISRTFEDWAPIDAPDRNQRFRQVLADVVAQLDASEQNDYLAAIREYERQPIVKGR